MTITEQQVAATIAFHGHMCPGIATGIRVAEVALAHVGRASQDEEVVAVAETQNCAVDAIQFLVGCTLGKGNLIIRDYGRNRFTFARRSDGLAVRITAKGRARRPDAAQDALIARVRSGAATPAELQAYGELWQARAHEVLVAEVADLFVTETLTDWTLPPKAVIEPSVTCARCCLAVMSSLTRRIDGRAICDGCWDELGARAISMPSVGVVRSALGPERPRDETGAGLARLELVPELAPGLTGLAPGQRLDVFWVFDRAARDYDLLQHPRGDSAAPKRGLFALHTPHRPAPLACTRVTIREIDGATLVVQGLDAWDGSPILDLKPAGA